MSDVRDRAKYAEHRVITGANPAANVEISEVVPAGKTWELISVSFLMVQGLTQTPQPILVLDDGVTVFFEMFGATNAQAASTTARYTFTQEGPQPAALVGTGTNVHAVGPLPDECILGPGFRVRTLTLGIGANSDYGAPALYVVEYTL